VDTVVPDLQAPEPGSPNDGSVSRGFSHVRVVPIDHVADMAVTLEGDPRDLYGAGPFDERRASACGCPLRRLTGRRG
jgi:hypothetical protein